MRLVMTIDNFDSEKFKDKLLLLSPLICGVIIFIAELVHGIYITKTTMLTENIPFHQAVINLLIPFAGGTFLLIFGLLCYFIMKNARKKTPNLYVDIDNLCFHAYDNDYYFSDLMPDFDVNKSPDSKLTFWYDFTLYLKNGSSIKLTLSREVANSFYNNYLIKYSKPVSEIKF